MAISRDPEEKQNRPGDEGSQRDINPMAFTQLQSHYLSLLESLIDRRNSYQVDPNREEWLLKAINKSTYSVYQSCVEVGMEEVARGLLKKVSQSN